MKKNNLIIYVLILCIVLLAVLLGINLFKSNSYTVSSNLPISRYVESPKSFAGNTYQLNGSIESQIAYSDDKGRVLIIKSIDTRESLPLMVPKSLEGFNPQTGQKYKLTVRIDQAGKLILTNFSKM